MISGFEEYFREIQKERPKERKFWVILGWNGNPLGRILESFFFFFFWRGFLLSFPTDIKICMIFLLDKNPVLLL